MARSRQVSRTTDWVEREYGREKWPGVEQLIEDVLAGEGDAPDLSRVVRQVARAERGWQGSAAVSHLFALGGGTVSAPLSAAAGAYTTLIAEAVVDACALGTDLVLDLGAGWGQHLLSAWLAGSARQATYVAAELTQAGRRAAARLAALVPELRFREIGFDLTAPDLSALGAFSSAVVLTVHAVEQVPILPAVFFDEVRKVAAEVRVVHVEPIGWQIQEGAPGPAREYAERNDYNQNFWSLLQAEASAGRLRIGTVLPDVVGINPVHPASLVTWSAPA